MAKKNTFTPIEVENDLEALKDTVNKIYKNETIAYFLGEDDSPSDIKEFISTGNDILDLIISNRKNGGIPIGRIVEFTGLEASGKSLLASTLLKSTQEKGGIGIYIDTENAVNEEFLYAIGVDTKKLLYIQLSVLEEIFETIEKLIGEIKKNYPGKLITIVVDSVAGATTIQEKESEYNKDGWATSKAIILSKAMRKITNMIGKERVLLIFTNQLRVKLGVSFGDAYCVDPFTTMIDIEYDV